MPTVQRDIVFVLIQFVFFTLYFLNLNVVEIQFPVWTAVISIVFSLLGVVIILFGIINLNDNITPFPTPRKNSSLISKGIYAYVRHPIYAGILVLMFSYAFFSDSIFRLVISLLLGFIFYFKSNLEERLLVQRFPEYNRYRKTTGRFFPKWK